MAVNDGTMSCYHCGGTGREPDLSALMAQLPYLARLSVYDRWETIRDLVGTPRVGQVALNAETGQKLAWDGQGWVAIVDNDGTVVG